MRFPTPRPALVAVLVLPMLVGTLVLWTLSERVDRLDAVPAAVVNLDEPVHTGKGKNREIVAAGRLLAAGLTQPDDEQPRGTLDWQVTQEQDAARGLREGDYYAVVTIPRDFSRTVAGLSGDDPARARITVRSNDAASSVVGKVGDHLGAAATEQLNQRITATFVEGVYARTGELRTALGSAEKGADRLAHGAVRLGRGTSALSSGADGLSSGLRRLSAGGAELSGGARRLSDGAGRLADGAGRLRAGSADLASGADRLGRGLDRLHRRTEPLPGATRRLADGSGRVAEGVQGWAQVLRGWRQACQSDPVLAASHVRLCAATVRAVGVDGGNAHDMVTGSRQVAAGADRLAAATPSLVDALDRSTVGARRLGAGAGRLSQGARRFEVGAARLATGADRVAAGAGRLSEGAARADEGATRLAGGSARVASGTDRLGAGSRSLARGLGRGVEEIPAHDEAERADIADVVARPVVSDTDRLNAAPTTATALVPAVLALALWLGAFVTYLVRRAFPRQAYDGAVRPLRAATAGWLPGVLIGAVQGALLLLLVTALDVVLVSPMGVAALMLLAAAVFAALHQAFVSLLGRRGGWLLSVALAALQGVALGGLLPLDTTPGPVALLAGLLPVPLLTEGLGALTLGGSVGSVAGVVVGLLAWGAGGLVLTAVAAGRAARSTVAGVRRRVLARDPA